MMYPRVEGAAFTPLLALRTSVWRFAEVREPELEFWGKTSWESFEVNTVPKVLLEKKRRLRRFAFAGGARLGQTGAAPGGETGGMRRRLATCCRRAAGLCRGGKREGRVLDIGDDHGEDFLELAVRRVGARR
ncbi:hypothetical protein AB3662_11755 [Sorangium cellulosum]|uniref:hypothetical protein n=1 Tax=Sorangium cellulosum TaxID=56 RepID=UPI003D9A4356